MEIIANTGVQAALNAFEDAVEKLDQIEVMPAAAQRLISLTSTDDPDIGEIHSAVTADPVLAARVLRLAASSIYGVSGARDMRAALIRIGARDLKRIAMANGLIGRRHQTPFYRWLWTYSLKTAAVTESLARAARRDSLDDPFLCGLLHDFGAVVMSYVLGAPYRRMMEETPAEELSETERVAYGYDHTDLGAVIAQQWRLLPVLETVIQMHHEPLLTVELGLPVPAQEATCLVALARQAVIVPEEQNPALADVLIKRLGITGEAHAAAVASGLEQYESGYATLLG